MSSQNSQENPAIYETQSCGTTSEHQDDNDLVHVNRRREIPFMARVNTGDLDSGELGEYDIYNADALDSLVAPFNISNDKFKSTPSRYVGDGLNESEILEPGAVTSKLHELCAKLGPGYTPLFQFDPVGPSGFSALLVINREEFVAKGPYKSKKEAKFEVATVGLRYVTALQEDMQQEDMQQEGGPCWMKYLNELCGLQKWTMDRPEYIVNVPNTFACIIRVNGHPYGDVSASYKSKRIARNEAARLSLQALCTDSTTTIPWQSQENQAKHKEVEYETVKEIGISGIPNENPSLIATKPTIVTSVPEVVGQDQNKMHKKNAAARKGIRNNKEIKKPNIMVSGTEVIAKDQETVGSKGDELAAGSKNEVATISPGDSLPASQTSGSPITVINGKVTISTNCGLNQTHFVNRSL
ncbi:hypothetical protein V1517DRAFT_312549 [Lipomyces orientalis]|uniref:Uncharacterized protein n=1 Tax=Lipomyces orientalis TaxID=1233043 RepID=A0ACC3TZC7_9ASCO